MNEAHIRKQLLIQNMDYSADRSNLLKQAAEAETYEEKDIAYRKAAVTGLRIDSVLKTIKEVNEATGDLGRQRAFQRHMRDMKRLKYTDRPAFATSDGLDMEVMSQFFQSDDPEQNQKYQEMMTGVKLKAGAPIPKGNGLVVDKKGAYSENEDSAYKVPVFVKEPETPVIPTKEDEDDDGDKSNDGVIDPAEPEPAITDNGLMSWNDIPLRGMRDLESSPITASNPVCVADVNSDAHKGLLGNIRKMLSENPMPPVIVVDSYQPSLADSTIAIQRTERSSNEPVIMERTKHRDKQ